MIKQGYYFSLFLYLILSLNVSGQINENSIPYSISEKLQEISSFVEMPSFDKTLFINEIRKQLLDRKKNYKFAKLFNTDLSPENSGEWCETNKGKVWRLGILSKDAYSIYLTFNKFQLDKGVKLFIYSPDYNEFRGAFTEKNNNNSNVLSIAPVPGEAIIVELNITPGNSEYGKLHISKVYHDCINEFGKNKSSNLKELQLKTCDEYINCSNGIYWQTEKNAVCKILIDGELCTGTLVGNTLGDNKPYILTADHCISDSVHASEAVFYFNYEYHSCGSDIIYDNQSLSGATLIATTQNKLDFALVKLNDIPPLAYHPYYAGWDINNISPQNGVCIHHPWGNAKQIAIDYHPLTTEGFSQDYDTLSAWKVLRWEIGTTQPGSSGAPLFNQQHKLVGNLMGGESTCEDPVNDYFTKFCLSWDKYDSIQNQLKIWLDPLHKGFTNIDGYDPYGFNINSCDTGWNIMSFEKTELSSSGLKWGWISGQNSSMFTKYAEKFNSPSTLQIPGIFLNVAKAYHSQPLSNIVIKVWEGNSTPSTEIYSKMIFIKSLQPNAVNFIGFDSILKITGSFFIGYEINYSNPMDTFAVYHAKNRGNSAPSSMFVYNGTWQNINTFGSIGISTSLAIGIIECYGKIHKPEIKTVNVYPNPCSNFIYIDAPPQMIIDGVECYDCTGRIVSSTFYPGEENNRLSFNIPSGVYFLRIKAGNAFFYSRFVVLKNE